VIIDMASPRLVKSIFY